MAIKTAQPSGRQVQGPCRRLRSWLRLQQKSGLSPTVCVRQSKYTVAAAKTQAFVVFFKPARDCRQPAANALNNLSSWQDEPGTDFAAMLNPHLCHRACISCLQQHASGGCLREFINFHFLDTENRRVSFGQGTDRPVGLPFPCTMNSLLAANSRISQPEIWHLACLCLKTSKHLPALLGRGMVPSSAIRPNTRRLEGGANSPLFCFRKGRLLVGQTMDRPQSPHQVNRMDADHGTPREEFG